LKSEGYLRRNEMGLVKIVAIVLILAGSLGLVYGGFSYTKDTQEAKIGPLELSVKETKTVNVPIWAGVAAIVAGGGLLLFSSKRT
jgi:TRAP-type C4-dicarboxylate transport system permease small subunit